MRSGKAKRLGDPLQEMEFAIHRLLINVLLLIDIVYSSRIYRTVGDFMQPALLGSAALIILIYTFYTLIRASLFPVLFGAIFMALIIYQITVFSDRAMIPFQFNVFFQFMWVLALIPFYAWTISGHRTYLLDRVVFFSTSYCGLYIILSLGQMSGTLPYGILSAITSDFDDRGTRVFLYLSTASIAYFYWLAQFKKRRRLKNLFFLTACTMAISLSLSRVFMLIIFCLSILYFINVRAWVVSHFSRGIFVVVTAYIFSGLLWSSFNPFGVFATDASGSYRAYEYVVVRREIFNEPLSGFGVPPDTKFAKPFLGEQDIFPSDLGALGAWFDLGLFGLILFIYCIWRCSEPIHLLEEKYGWPLLLSGSMMTAYGGISPLAMSAPGGATLTALIFGVGMGSRIIALRKRKPSGNKLAGEVLSRGELPHEFPK